MPETTPSIEFLTSLDEDTVRTLRKEELRQYFFAIQSHLQTTLVPKPATSLPPLPRLLPNPQCPSTFQPTLLRLPLEVRQLIYSFLLQDPTPGPTIRGPHPRQLQLPLTFTQCFPSSLLLVCKQICSEAVPILYGSPHQTILVTINYDFWRHTGERSSLNVSQRVVGSIRNLRLLVFLGSESKNHKPTSREAKRRLEVVKKGVRKLSRWFLAASTRIQTLVIDWKEPPCTFTWEQKKEVLDGLRILNPDTVLAGEINWGLNYPGRRYRFETAYIESLQSKRRACPEHGLRQASIDY